MSRAFLPKEAAHRFAQARIDAITRLGELAQENSAQFIVVAGDVFESNQLSRITLVRTCDALKALPVPVYLLPGNHDPLDGSSIFNTEEINSAGKHVIVLRNTDPVPVPGLDDVEVIGVPWFSKRPTSDLCGDLLSDLEPSPGVTRIVVAHGQVTSLSPDKTQPEIINQEKVVAAVTEELVQYIALGDRHSVYCVGDSNRIWYSGAPVATDFTEDDPNHTLLVKLEGTESCQVKKLPVGSWHFLAPHFDLNGQQDLDTLAAWLEALEAKDRSIIKVGFTGSVNLAVAARLEQLLEDKSDSFASLRRRERTTDLAIVPDGLDEDSVSLSGYAKAAWNELVELAKEGDESARAALQLFYRLSGEAVQT